MVQDVQGGEGGEVELAQGLATSNFGMPGKSGEGRKYGSGSLENIIRTLHFELPSSAYPVRETHGAVAEKLLGSNSGAKSLERLLKAGAASVMARAH